jgi:hypothetical protein
MSISIFYKSPSIKQQESLYEQIKDTIKYYKQTNYE